MDVLKASIDALFMTVNSDPSRRHSIDALFMAVNSNPSRIHSILVGIFSYSYRHIETQKRREKLQDRE